MIENSKPVLVNNLKPQDSKECFFKLKEYKDELKKLNAQVKIIEESLKNQEEQCINYLTKNKLPALKIPKVGVFTLKEKREFYNPSSYADKLEVYGYVVEILGGYDKFMDVASINHQTFNSLINKMQPELEEFFNKKGLKAPEGHIRGKQLIEQSEKETNKEKKHAMRLAGERLMAVNPYAFPGIKSNKLRQSISVTKK